MSSVATAPHDQPAPVAQPSDAIARLVANHGATEPTLDLIAAANDRPLRPPLGPPSLEIIDELRAERL